MHSSKRQKLLTQNGFAECIGTLNVSTDALSECELVANLLESLPHELLIRIFHSLHSFKDFHALRRANKYFYNISCDKDMWRKLDLSRVASKVTDERFMRLINGPNESILELSLRGCTKITDISIQGLASSCTNLTSIDLSGCEPLKNGTLENVGLLTRLQHVALCDSKLGLSGLRMIVENCTGLCSLDLANCGMLQDSSLAPLLRASSSLRVLDLSSTKVTGSFVKRMLHHLTQLEELYLHHCLSLFHDSGKKQQSSPAQLHTLMISGASPHNSVRDPFVAAIIGQSILRVLECTRMRSVQGYFLLDLPPVQLAQLVHIKLSWTSVDDDVFLHIAQSCPLLSRLALEWCALKGDEIVQCEGLQLPNLKLLRLSGCPISEGAVNYILDRAPLLKPEYCAISMCRNVPIKRRSQLGRSLATTYAV